MLFRNVYLATSRLLLCKERVAVYCESHMEHINTLCLKYKDPKYSSRWYIYLLLCFKGLLLNFNCISFGIPINKYSHCELLDVTSDNSGFVAIRPQKRNDYPPLNCLSDNVLRRKRTAVSAFSQCYCNLLTEAIQPAPQFNAIHTQGITGRTQNGDFIQTYRLMFR